MDTVFFIGQIIGVGSVFVLLFFVLAQLVSHVGGGLDGVGRAVLITGCDSGFGHQLARALDQKGFVVFAGCLSPEGTGAQSLARQSSRNLRVLQLDVTRDEEVLQAKKVVHDNLPDKGEGLARGFSGIRCNVEEFLLGLVDVTNECFYVSGRMVYTSSIFAFFNCLNMAAYSVSKRGLEAFADCLRVEMASFGVKVSIIQPGNFGRATNILKMKTASDIWEKLDGERKLIFNRQYMELANEYFLSTCSSGFKNADMVIDAMLHAITSARPRRRYLLVSARDAVFFRLLPFLPGALTDAVFSLSSVYAKRKEMLYAKKERL
ncbi:D-beta-hydroxybutyrate dehydrogenase, mitochondrial [Etheostoma cragini]|uniref:D-beta-hydroxybutyrate dehydrogenase, mitochondrial n=1 Tax=Etheostoma cragini TaxID=417921 RepID=UPI00155E90B7|nr:D-beta-hydroxybutyrate dehydrogenase, mitochondrial [Etheostoma cragini]